MKLQFNQHQFSFSAAIVYMTKLLMVVLSMAFLAHTAAAENHQSSNTLELVDTPHFDTFHVATDATIPVSRKIYIGEIEASFANDWIRRFRVITSPNYRRQTLSTYSQTLRDHIKEKLTSSGWQVLDRHEEGSIKINVKLKDIYIYGPQKLDMAHVLVANIGQSGMEITVEGADNQPILKIEDHRQVGGLNDFFIEADNAVNFNWFNKLMKRWARDFAIYVDMMTDLAAVKT